MDGLNGWDGLDWISEGTSSMSKRSAVLIMPSEIQVAPPEAMFCSNIAGQICGNTLCGHLPTAGKLQMTQSLCSV